MQLRLSELKAQRTRETGERITWEDISEATGIGVNTLSALDRGTLLQIRNDYFDALATYFNVDIDELVQLERIDLPITTKRGRTATVTVEDAERGKFLAYLDDMALLTEESIEELIKALWHSKDPLPDEYAKKLDLDPPATYAQAAQKVRRDREVANQ